MKNAIIIYQSKTGTTRQLAYEIKEILEGQNILADVSSVCKANKQELNHYDYVFLGCWTKGLMVIGQHPDPAWKNTARSLTISSDSRIVLFTTYKLLTGRMFRQMQKYLPAGSNQQTKLCIKSRNGQLKDTESNKLQNFINSNF